MGFVVGTYNRDPETGFLQRMTDDEPVYILIGTIPTYRRVPLQDRIRFAAISILSSALVSHMKDPVSASPSVFALGCSLTLGFLSTLNRS